MRIAQFPTLTLCIRAQPATETRLRSIQGNWHPDKRLSDVGNQHNTSMPDSELVTEDQLVEGYLKRLGGKQRRYFSKLLFESESTYYIRIRETHNQNVDNKTLLKEFDEILLNSARPGSILPQDPNHLAIILCEAPTKSSNIIPFRQDIFVNIMEKLAIPVGLYQALLTGTPKSVFYVAGEYYQRPGFVLRTPVSGTENWTLALSWNTRFIALRGIILGLQGSEKSRLAMHLGDTMAESAHPMNIPVILCEMLIESDSTGVKTHASNLYQVELRTKLHGYPQTESSARSSKLAETPEKDFEDMTRSLNVIISRLAFHEMRIHANAVFVEQITSHIHTEPPSSKAYDEMYPRLHSMSQNLRERLNHLQTEQRALLLEISCNQKIAQSQLQIVYNLIAQRDNKENLAMAELQTELARIQTTIANTTKDDSYAMRTIAVMSIAFLPGTFVSSFFSMDMFNWQAPKGASVLSFRFWIYWAVTAPLTLVVVLIWFFWLRAHKKREVNGRKDSTPTNTPLFRLARLARLTEPTSDDSKKQSWFQRRWERTLPKDEEKQTIQAIQSMHSSFAVIPVESTLRSRAPAAQIQRSETVLQGPVR
jgi:Mg2+ and Co2+ transporter CorA